MRRYTYAPSNVRFIGRKRPQWKGPADPATAPPEAATAFTLETLEIAKRVLRKNDPDRK